MLLYSIIMFLAAIPMIGIGIAIYKGKTDLIHDYHQTKVTDKVGYGRAFGKAMLVISAALLLSGIIALFGETKVVLAVSLSLLFIGLLVGITLIVLVQKKYNKGVF